MLNLFIKQLDIKKKKRLDKLLTLYKYLKKYVYISNIFVVTVVKYTKFISRLG